MRRHSVVKLPIDPVLPKLVQCLQNASNLILKAAPGSGKTTRVPPALLDVFPGRVLVLEPRRLAAKYSARRVAEEMGEEIGRTVGYQFRFENVGGPNTRLRFVTEGMLMRLLLSDPELRDVSAVVLDEFHERHLHTDTALAYLRSLQKRSRPDLRIIVMSATLDTEPLSAYLGNAPVLEVEHRPHPVSVHYLPSQRPLETQIRDAVALALEDSSDQGDILVFLPGMAEIRRCERKLDEHFESERGRPGSPLILALHGELSREKQDRAILKADRRKIILATNVAETSLTIEGVTVVIDSGLHRIATYSWWSGVPSLKTKPIPRASASQRAGRAGRTAPGRCYRAYGIGDFEGRPPFETPEIQRADLSQTLLELKAMGATDIAALQWFEPPSPSSIEASSKLLYRLGALETPASSAALTEIGKRLASLPLHPRLGRFLLEATRLGCLEEAATLASWLSEGRTEKVDILDCLRLPLSDSQRKLRTQLLSALRQQSLRGKPGPSLSTQEDRLRFALLTGFPDRVSRKRKASSQSQRAHAVEAAKARYAYNETELLFSSGGSAAIEQSGVVLTSDFFVTLDLRETKPMGQVRARLQASLVSPIEMDWLLELEPSLLEDREIYNWDAGRARVMQLSQLVYDELVLEESSRPASPSPAVSSVLMKSTLGIDPDSPAVLAARDWIAAFGRIADPEMLEGAFARALLLKQYAPELAFDFDPTQGFRSLKTIFEGKTSRADLENTNLASEILMALVPEALGRLDQLLPEALALPSGRRAKVHYALEKPPWVESRLQDFFGMKSAPALLGGRLPLTLHLLAPNGRAVQVTTDLAGFWERGYREQRNSLSRRYPRHPWPEDPVTASPLPRKPGR